VEDQSVVGHKGRAENADITTTTTTTQQDNRDYTYNLLQEEDWAQFLVVSSSQQAMQERMCITDT
jgi:hypothetical protein